MQGSRKVASIPRARPSFACLLTSSNTFRPFRALILAAILGLTGQACSLDRTSALGEAPVTLTVGIAQPRPGGPPGVGVEQVISTLTGAALLTIGRDGRAIPGLAREWAPSADGLTWRFTLQSNLTRHDGTPLTATQIASALSKSASRAGFVGLEDVQSIEADGELGLVVRLERPSSLLLEALRLTPISDTRDENQGAGPFRLDLTRDESGAKDSASGEPEDVTLNAFEGYFKGRPAIDRIVLRLYPAARTAWSALMRGEVDFLYEVPPEALEFIEAASSLRAYSFLRPYVSVLVFNIRHPVLERRDVRLALNAAVDREELLRMALHGRGQPATGPIYPLHWAYDPSLEPVEQSPELAERLLDEADLPRPSEAALGTMEGAPSRFNFTCLIPGNSERLERLALVLQRQLLAVGVDLRLAPVTNDEFASQLRSGKFDAFLVELNAGPGMNLPYSFWHSVSRPSAFFDSGYASADGPLEAIRLAQTDDDLRRAIHEFQRVARADPPGLFLLWSQTARAVRTRFEFPADRDQDIVSTINQWRARSPRGETHE